jgi:hypothetical protein
MLKICEQCLWDAAWNVRAQPVKGNHKFLVPRRFRDFVLYALRSANMARKCVDQRMSALWSILDVFPCFVRIPWAFSIDHLQL